MGDYDDYVKEEERRFLNEQTERADAEREQSLLRIAEKLKAAGDAVDWEMFRHQFD